MLQNSIEKQYITGLINRRSGRISHLKKLRFSLVEQRSYVGQFVKRDYELGLVNLDKVIALNEMAILLLDLSLYSDFWRSHPP